MTQNDFAFRIDRWTDDGERIVEHVAGAEDFQIAMATYPRPWWPSPGRAQPTPRAAQS